MFLNLGINTNIRHCFHGLIYLTAILSYGAALKEYDACVMHDGSSGICRNFLECEAVLDSLKRNETKFNSIVSCGFEGINEIICCSSPEQTSPSIPAASPQKIKSKRETTKNLQQRPAEKACNDLKKNRTPKLVPRIVIAPAVFPGEYPFMAALGYSESEDAPYEFRCGGTLIHDRFVLTAATCVNMMQPSIVRLGMVNFDKQSYRMDVPIKKVHIHPEYKPLDYNNNVALLEFENPVNKSRYIMPICLNIDNVDSLSDASLFIAGWGVKNSTTKELSRQLLKTIMELEPVSNCNATYKNLDYTLQPEHLCAKNIDPINPHKPCVGDSGGPLFLQMDPTIDDIQQVGIISSGIGCSNNNPSVYMRVSAYLDFIENIVWPLQ